MTDTIIYHGEEVDRDYPGQVAAATAKDLLPDQEESLCPHSIPGG